MSVFPKMVKHSTSPKAETEIDFFEIEYELVFQNCFLFPDLVKCEI